MQTSRMRLMRTKMTRRSSETYADSTRGESIIELTSSCIAKASLRGGVHSVLMPPVPTAGLGKIWEKSRPIFFLTLPVLA